MGKHPFPVVGWILDNSCGDSNYKSNIPQLSKEALLYCLCKENRKTGFAKLKEEAKRRGFNWEVIHGELVRGDNPMGIQSTIEAILESYSLKEQFSDESVESVYLKLAKSEVNLEIQRTQRRIEISHLVNDHTAGTVRRPLLVFSLLPGNPLWRPERLEIPSNTITVIVIEDSRPVLSYKGYLDFTEFAVNYNERLIMENWQEAKIVIKQINGQTVGRDEAGSNLLQGRVKLPGERLSSFQSYVEKILGKHQLLERFYDSSCGSVYLKLRQENFLDFVIERQGDIIMIGHYRKENGDLISDPIMRYRLVPGFREWDITGIEQVFGNSEVYVEHDGKTLINRSLKAQLKSFANVFAKNLKWQDWLNAEVVAMEYENDQGEEVEVIDESSGHGKMAEHSIEESEPVSLVTSDNGQIAFAFF